jgi:peptidoglycan/xylan/chitin deacetylase (PgdA/CDA1 family)
MDRKPGSKAGARRKVVVIGAVAAGVALAVLVALGFFLIPLPVTVDGHTVSVRAGTTVGELASRRLFTGHNGDLLSVKDKRVVGKGGGQPAIIYVGDQRASLDMRVWPFSTVRSINGPDSVEKVVTTKRAIPIEARWIGQGPLVYMSQPGNVGVKMVERGAVSGDLVKSRTVIEGQPAVFMRTSYTGGAKEIALTFDDGPWPKNTTAILKILTSYKVKATFFELGTNVYTHPELAKAVAAAGMDIGNHSETHPQLPKLSGKQIAWQIEAAQRMIKNKTGKTPVWFRPPYGAVNRAVYAQANADKVRVVLWSVDTEDWRKPPVTSIIARALAGARPGAVILMHDGGGNRDKTIAALPGVITRLQALGYKFVTLDQLFAKRAAPKAPAAKVPTPKG